MSTLQIIAGGNINEALKECALTANKLIETVSKFSDSGIQVWELSETDYKQLKAFAHPSEWDSEKFGWWRNDDTNVSKNEIISFDVNGTTMLGFKNNHNYYHSEEFLRDCKEEGEEPYLPSYFDLFEYLDLYWGATKDTNVALFIKSLSKINNLSPAGFVAKYVKLVNDLS